MVKEQSVHIMVPVKDSFDTAEDTIRAIVDSGYMPCVYDDYSSAEVAARLDTLQAELGFELVHLSELVNTPSPNYRRMLTDAQHRCIEKGQHLVIVESDVSVTPSTIRTMVAAVTSKTGLIAAVTTDGNGTVNFPYEYARDWKTDGICKERLSFCCTLLTLDFLRAYPFEQLDPAKDWYDVHISRMARKLGFCNILQISNPVLHRPHSSRPWKQLKYTHPLRYYWRKLTRGMDKI